MRRGSSVVERKPEELSVVGSIPTPGTTSTLAVSAIAPKERRLDPGLPTRQATSGYASCFVRAVPAVTLVKAGCGEARKSVDVWQAN